MKKDNFFWVSYSDLMTSLFFVMLVLYTLTYVMLQTTVQNLEQKLEVYDLVKENLNPLKENTELFRYEKEYKRFTLAFDVAFERGDSKIKRGKLKRYSYTLSKIKSVGIELRKTIDLLAKKKTENKKMKNVSYLVIISGYASHLEHGTISRDYELSYKRAFNLWYFWRNKMGIDFEADKYKGLIDLQISGNGWGGVGRFPRDSDRNFIEESKNQRFIIQIVPKIGEVI